MTNRPSYLPPTAAPRRATRRAYFIAEVVIGSALVAVLMLALSAMVGRQNRAAATLAQQRSLTRAAEQVLLAVQTPEVPMPDEASVRIEPLDGGDTLVGWQWVRVHVSRDGVTASLIGMARPQLLSRAAGSAGEVQP